MARLRWRTKELKHETGTRGKFASLCPRQAMTETHGQDQDSGNVAVTFHSERTFLQWPLTVSSIHFVFSF